jgi:hypothetical protein
VLGGQCGLLFVECSIRGCGGAWRGLLALLRLLLLLLLLRLLQTMALL